MSCVAFIFTQENEAEPAEDAPKVKKSPGRPKGSKNKNRKVCNV